MICLINIAICDDEYDDCMLLKKYIEEYITDYEIDYSISVYLTGKDLLSSSKKFDLIFLDIIMDDLDGIDIARYYKNKQSKQKIFFISSSNAYLKEGYRVQAVRYLTKPIDKEELFEDLSEILKQTIRDSQYIYDEAIPTQKIYLSDIRYIEVMGRNSYVHTSDKIYHSKKQLKVWLKELELYHFYRIHNSYLVNIEYVYDIKFDKVILKDGCELPLSRTYQKNFKDDYYNYLGDL